MPWRWRGAVAAGAVLLTLFVLALVGQAIGGIGRGTAGGPARPPGLPRWAAAGGLRLKVYASSLGCVMGVVFVLSWLAQSITGVAAYNEEQLRHLQAPDSWSTYVVSADFWNRTLQNWQSEFLAIASMAILSIYLRQRGSPESKPVGAAHATTGVEG